MNTTFIATLIIILLILIGSLYLYNCNKINNLNKNNNDSINDKKLEKKNTKESFTSYIEHYNAPFPESNFYNAYNYNDTTSNNVTGSLNKDSFDDNHQKMVATFLSLIKVLDNELKDKEYNYMVEHIFRVKITSNPTTITQGQSLKILYETFAKTDNRTDNNNSIHGDLLSLNLINQSYLTANFIENTIGVPMEHTYYSNNQNNLSCRITILFIRKTGGYTSRIKLELLNNETPFFTVPIITETSPNKHFLLELRNIAVLTANNVSFQVSSQVKAGVYPSYTNTLFKIRRGDVQGNIIQNKTSTEIPNFQTIYSTKLENVSGIVDPGDSGQNNFSMPSTPVIGININNDATKSFFFNGEINGENIFKSIPLPNNDPTPIQDYVYNKGYLIILNTSNRLYYCKNCKIHTGMAQNEWTQISIPSSYATSWMHKIAYDGTNNILFLLNREKKLLYCTGLGTTRMTFNYLTPPPDEYLFADMDAINGKIAGIGEYTRYLFLGEYSSVGNVRTPSWRIIDKSKTITSVSLNVKGLIGKDSSQSSYFCQFPCYLKGSNKWVQLSDDVTKNISANTNLLALVKNNNIYTCKDSCNKDSFTKSNQIGVYSAKAIDYYYPFIDVQESPFNNLPQIKINSRSTKIDTYSNSINKILTNIDNNMQIFKNKQEQFQIFLLRQIAQRDKYIRHINKGYSCLDYLIDKSGTDKNAKNSAICVDYKKGEKEYKASLLADALNEKSILEAEIAASMPTSAPTAAPTVDPESEFFDNNIGNKKGNWTEYFTNYSSQTLEDMLTKLGNVKINMDDLESSGEDLIAVME